jgi:hypothetical protein
MNNNNLNYLEVYLFEYENSPAYCMQFPKSNAVAHLEASNQRLNIQPVMDLPLCEHLILPIYKCKIFILFFLLKYKIFSESGSILKDSVSLVRP